MKVLKIIKSHLFVHGEKVPKGAIISEHRIKDDKETVCAYNPKKNEFLDDIEFSQFNKNKHVLVLDNEHYRVLHIDDKS